jgi:hypothetical protein
MRQIRISLRAPSLYGEVDYEDLDVAKYAIEACASRALLELLGPVIVDEVEISVGDACASEDEPPTAHPP